MNRKRWLPKLADIDPLLREMWFRGALAVGLYAVFPAFSDIYRLWRRENGLTGGFAIGEIEYPPLGALYFEPLSHLPSSRWAVIVNGLIMVVAAVIVTSLLIRARQRAPSGSSIDVRMWVGSPALLILLPVNWDVAVAAIGVGAVASIYADRAGRAGLLLGAGTALKLAPGYMVPPLAPLLEGWRRRIEFLAGGAVVLGVSYLAYWLVRPGTWRTHLEFAAERDDYNSTVWGLLDGFLGLFDIELGNEVITTISSVALVVGIGAVTVWAWLRKPDVVVGAASSMIVLLLLTKVFKPQYLLWALPLLAWVGVRRWWVRLLEVTVLVQFAVIYFEIPEAFDYVATGARLVGLAVIGWQLVHTKRRWTTRTQSEGLT